MRRLLRDLFILGLGALGWAMVSANMNRRAEETALIVAKEAPRPVGYYDPQRRLSWPVGGCPKGVQHFAHYGGPTKPVHRCVESADLRTAR